MFRFTKKPKPVVLCVLDGWGIAKDYPGNAITRANCATFNGYWFSYPHALLTSSGKLVGVPEGQVGNSEVGHMNLGAGRIVFQDSLRIDMAIENGSFFENQALLKAIEHAQKYHSNIHLLGLIGEGAVHSKVKHLMAILALFKNHNVSPSKVKLHLFTDGRDSPPTSAKVYLSEITQALKAQNLGQIASVCGRYFAMDRDNRWERTEKAYQAIMGQGENKENDPLKVVEKSYFEGITDEFIKPTIIVDSTGHPVGSVLANDAVIFFNFRPDRARQLTKAFVLDKLGKAKTSSGETVETFKRGSKIENLFFVSFSQYEKNLNVSAIAFTSEQVAMPLSRVISERDLRQFHVAETEKYAHVTYFFNGRRELPFPGEDRLLVNSPKVASYDLAPEMSTIEVTRQLIRRINAQVYDFIIANFANADMLGHTGNIEAAIKAIKTIDFHLGVVAKAALAIGGGVIITADHGNAEEMINTQSNEPDTAHNANPVPCIFVFRELLGMNRQLQKGILADVAPTILSIMQIPKPYQMTGRNLLE